MPETIVSIFNWLLQLIHDNQEKIVAIGTAIIAIYTIVLARVGRNQSKETKILQRAYLAVDPMGLWPQGINEVNPLYRVKNAGRLPARNIKWFAYARADSDKDAKIFEIKETDLYGDNILAADAGMTHGTGAMAMNAPYIFVWGIVRYDDGFGKQRFTKFCHRYNTAARQIFPGPNVPVQYYVPAETGRHHGWGNSTDES